MNFSFALAQIKAAVTHAHGRRVDMEARRAFRHRQLQAAKINPKGWPWQYRTQWVQNAGGYETGKLSTTQGSRDATLAGGTFPDPCAGWFLGSSDSDTELYRIESRTAASAVKFDRPYEGTAASGAEYTMYDPYLRAPSDLYAWKAICLEADGNKLCDSDLELVRGQWPKQVDLDTGWIICLGEASMEAGYETGTVTVAKGSTAVTGAATVFPEWIAGHHFQLKDEGVLYRIKQWGSDTLLTLDRPYGGDAENAGLGYAIDPAGAIRLEVTYPRLNRFAAKIDYLCLPQELANDSDPVEGDEAYAALLVDLATADVLRCTIDPDRMTEGMLQELYQRAGTYEKRGMQSLSGMVGSNAPHPEGENVLQDIRYSGSGPGSGRWSALDEEVYWW